MAKESRREPRRPHDSVLEILDKAGKTVQEIGRLVNVSASGACFSSTATISIGQKIRARLRLMQEGSLEIEGHVVWVKKKSNTNQYGVKFDRVKR